MDSSDSLQDFYDSIDLDRIRRFVAERYQEDHLLDFKTVGLTADWRSMTKEEKNHLAKALSGFANTGGGILVWGVGANKDSDGVDAATELKPFPNPGAVLSELQSKIHAAVDPAVRGVACKAVEDGDRGYAVMMIPETDGGPHMAKFGEDRYYMRSGDSFIKMSHQQIADMFGRRPHPYLKVAFESPNFQLQGGLVPKFEVRVLVTLHNSGRGIARFPHLTIRSLSESWGVYHYGIDGNCNTGLPQLRANTGVGVAVFAGGTNDVIHPSQTIRVLCLVTPPTPGPRFDQRDYHERDSIPDLEMHFTISADGMQPEHDTLILTRTEMLAANAK